MSTDAVSLSSYRDDWPVRFASASARLLAALGTQFAVEHIGSTSVPGLSAKDSIDVLVVAPTRAAFDVATPLIQEIGFDYRPGAFPDEPLHRFFRRVEGGVRTHHVHLHIQGSVKVHGYLAFRALLRSDACARQEYAEVKQRLVTASPGDRRAYIEGKAPVVESLLERALLLWPASNDPL